MNKYIADETLLQVVYNAQPERPAIYLYESLFAQQVDSHGADVIKRMRRCCMRQLCLLGP